MNRGGASKFAAAPAETSGLPRSQIAGRSRRPTIHHSRFTIHLRLCLAALALLLTAATPEEDWRAILALDAGPQAAFRDRAEAATLARGHLERQASLLREFIARHGDDPRAWAARVRQASVRFAQARLDGGASGEAEATAMLRRIEDDAAAPREARADAAFARIGQFMQRLAVLAPPARQERREEMLALAREFQRRHPGDHRAAALLAEAAGLWDAQPARKRALLEEARDLARSLPAGAGTTILQRRIADDLRRLALLGRPLEATLTPRGGGAPVVLAARRGRVMAVVFWASWSAPARREMERLRDALAQPDLAGVEGLAVSVDEDGAALDAAARELRWTLPVHWSGRGWEDPLVRSLGVNALPTLFILDRAGRVTDLNATGRPAEALRAALRDGQ